MKIFNEKPLSQIRAEREQRSIEPSIAPVETVITSGFAAGWSGSITFSKAQEGIVILKIFSLIKTSDIVTGSGEVVYTLPVSFRPKNSSRFSLVGFNSSNVNVANSAVDLVVDASGEVKLANIGSVTTGVRRINAAQIFAL